MSYYQLNFRRREKHETADVVLRVPTEDSFEELKIVGLATERCHFIDGALARLHFRLSDLPPLGWSYTFTTVWQAVQYSHKRPAGVESDAIWIECIPEEVGACHREELEKAAAQTNAKYRERIEQQALSAGQQAELEAWLQLQLEELNRTLYPPEPPPDSSSARLRIWGSALLAKLGQLLRRNRKPEN